MVKATARERKVIAVGAVIAVCVLAYYAVTLLPSGDDLSQAVEIKKKMLLKQRETLAREGTYKTRLEQYEKVLKQHATRLLPGDSANVAGAELQKILTELAEQSSVESLRKTSCQRKKPRTGFKRYPCASTPTALRSSWYS